ncbi:MAG: hypothetical protein KTR29_23320 [Rhodothermaceae bacterium]|nr:hypothetical protein [Rhodothermaceae bacterium]
MKSIYTLISLIFLFVITGCDSQLTEVPEDERVSLSHEERSFLATKGLASSQYESYSRTQARVYTFDSGEQVGHANLIRFSKSVMGNVRTTGLEPGTATTLWMVVFNAPENCSDGECGSNDFRNLDVRADLLWVDGGIIDDSGRIQYRVFKDQDDTSGSIADPLLGQPAYGIEDAQRTEVHFVIRTHGPVIPGFEYEMTHTFNGCCQLNGLPDDPRLGPVGPSICENLQFALFIP